MNCTLTVKQQELLFQKVVIDLNKLDKFDFKSYAQTFYNLVESKTKDPVLAANYVAMLPANIRALFGIDKTVSRKIAASIPEITDLEEKFEDFKNVEKFVSQFKTAVADIVALEKTIQAESLVTPPVQEQAPEAQELPPIDSSMVLSDIPMDNDLNNFLKPEMRIYADTKATLIKNVQQDGTSKLEDGTPVRLTIMSTQGFLPEDFYPDTQKALAANEPRSVAGMKTGVVMAVTDLKGEPVKIDGRIIYYTIRKPQDTFNAEDRKLVARVVQEQKINQAEAEVIVRKKLDVLSKVREYVGKNPTKNKVFVSLAGGVENYAAVPAKNKPFISALSFGQGGFAPYKGYRNGQRPNVYYFDVPGTNITLPVDSASSIPNDVVEKLINLLVTDLVVMQGSKSVPYATPEKIKLFKQFVYTDPETFDLGVGSLGELVVKKTGVIQTYPTKEALIEDLRDVLSRRTPIKKITEEQAKKQIFQYGRAVNLKTAMYNQVWEKVLPNGNVEYHVIGQVQLKINDTAFKNNQFNDFTITGNAIKVESKPYYPFIASNFVIGYEVNNGKLQPAGSVFNFQVSPESFVSIVKAENAPEKKYKELPLVETQIVNNKGQRGGAQYNKVDNVIRFDPEILRQKFEEKAWTKPKVEGVKALPANTFKTYEEWENFAIEHEYQHSKIKQGDNESLADYENRVNDAAFKSLGKAPEPAQPGLFDDKGNLNPAAYENTLPPKVSGINEAPKERKLSAKEQLLQKRKNNPTGFNKIINQGTVEATEEQIQKAREWYSTSILSTYFPFKALFDLVNQQDSNVIANWVLSGVTLYKGADYSDLYHEAWHGFTQGLLSQEEKTALYEEAKKRTGSFVDYTGKQVKFKDATDLQIEEFLAEDFREYMISDGKLVFKAYPVKNTLFRKIYNFLRSLFGTTSVKQTVVDEMVSQKVEELYRKLRVGDLSEYTFAAENRNYNTLNKALQSINPSEVEKSLTFQNSNLLFNTVESLFSEGVDILNQANISDIKTRRELQAKVDRTPEEEELLKQLNTQTTSSYTTMMLSTTKGLRTLYEYVKSALSDKLADNLELAKTDTSTELQKQIDLLRYALRNFGNVNEIYANKKEDGVIGYHLFKSGLIEPEVFDEIKELQETEGRANEGKNYYDRGGNEVSIFDLASREVKTILRSLNKTDLNGNVINNALGFPELIPFKQAFAYTARVLQNSKDITEMYSRLEKEAKIYPPMQQLLDKLGPLSYEGQTDREVDLWSKFFQAMNKYRIPLIQTTINEKQNINEFGEVGKSDFDLRIGNALADVKAVDRYWREEFKRVSDNPFIRNDISGNYLNVHGVLEKWNTIDKVNANPIEFLNDIGIGVSNIGAVRDELNKDIESGKIRLNGIYKNLNKLDELGVRVRGMGAFLTEDKGRGIIGQTGPNSNYGKILTIQSKYSGEYSDYMVKNAEGEPQSEFSQNNTLTQLVKIFNNVRSYNELVANGPTAHYNNAKNVPGRPYNPFVNSSIWMSSLFDMTKPEGPKSDNEFVIENLSGINSSLNDEFFDEGVALSQADEVGKLINDFHMQLMKFTPELTRHAGKKTSLAVSLRHYKAGAKNTRLYIDPENFIASAGEFNLGLDSFVNIMFKYISAELDRVNYCKYLSTPGADVKQFDFNYLERGKKFVAFEGVLSTETKNELYESTGDWRTNQELQAKVYDEVAEYLMKLSNEVNEKMTEIGFVSPTLIGNLREAGKRMGKPNNLLSDAALTKSLSTAFVANNWIHHFEEMIMLYGDIALYKDFFKRNASMNSTGDIIRTDEPFKSYVNNKVGRKFTEQLGVTDGLAWNGMLNAAIVSDVEVKSAYVDEYKKSISPAIVDGKYGEVNEADAQGLIAMDSYRIILKGLSKWTQAQEAVYNDLLKGKPVDTLEVVNFFPVLKMGYYGPVQNDYLPITGLHKFALFPLIPGAIPQNLQKLHEKMMKEGIDYLTFKSGSKVGTITNKSGMEPLYSDSTKRILNEAPFVKNPVFSEYLKYQVESAPYFKGKVTLMTQLRKLAELGLMEAGMPTDYSGTKESWNAMPETDRRNVSKNYEVRQNYIKALQDLVEVNKEKILRDIGWSRDTKGQLVGDMSNLLRLISNELKRSDVGDHEWAYIQTIKGNEIKNALDVSQSADMIEKVITALVNKRLVNIKVNGEQLVMVSTTGFEDLGFAYQEGRNFEKPTPEDLKKYGTNDLPTYHIGEDGLIRAAKVKIAMQGKFKSLLSLPEVKDKAKLLGVSELQALNLLLKDDTWLEEGDNRWFITMVGARIPTQGPNSAEFVEVYEFLPEIAGNIIIAPTEVTAKSGTDFDYDKLPLLMPNINVRNGKVELARKYTTEEAQEIYNALINAKVHKMAFEGLSKPEIRMVIKNSEQFSMIEETIARLWGPDYFDRLVEIAKEENGIPDFNKFLADLNGSDDVIQNNIIKTMRAMLEQPSNFADLIRPNDTDIVKPLADELYATEFGADTKNKDKQGTRIFEPLHNLKIQQANSIGKDTLGIGAISNTFNAVYNAAGLTLNRGYGSEDNPKRATILLPHNTINGGISLSNRVDALNQNNIGDVISQLINGWVDVEKDDWISYIQGNKELSPVLLFMVQAGVPIKDAVYFVSQPLIKQCAKEQRVLGGNFAKALGKNIKLTPKRGARVEILSNKGNGFKLPNYKAKTVYEKTLELTEGINRFDTKTLRANIDKFAKDKNAPITDFDRAVFLHFLELEALSSEVEKLQRAFNVDTTPIQTISGFFTKINDIEGLNESTLISQDVIEEIKNNSPVGPFYVQPFALDLFDKVMPIRNSVEVNTFIENEVPIEVREATYPDRDVFSRMFKNDLMSYIFQNEVRNFPKPENADYVQLKIIDEAPLDGINFTNEGEYFQFFKERESLRERYPFASINADIDFGLLVEENFKKDDLRKEGESDEDFLQRVEKISYEQWLRNKALYNILNPSMLFKHKENIASKFEYIINKYPHLKANFSVLTNIKKTSKDGFTNLMLATMKLSKDDIDTFYENFQDLANSNKLLQVQGIDQRDADYIAEFFGNFPIWMYLQSGPNTKNPFSFGRVMPNDKILRILEKPVKELTGLLNSIPETEEGQFEKDQKISKYLFDFTDQFILTNTEKSTRQRFKDFVKNGYEVTEINEPTMQTKLFEDEVDKASTIDKTQQYTKDEYDSALGTASTFLSNFEQLSNPITDEYGNEYYNSEGYYMALRTSDLAIKKEIADMSKEGGKASRKARRKFDLEMNEDLRANYMLMAVRAKFNANPGLAKQLLETGYQTIIEKNYWKDDLFGVREDTLRGANVLGKTLMQVRDELRSSSSAEGPPPLTISNEELKEQINQCKNPL